MGLSSYSAGLKREGVDVKQQQRKSHLYKMKMLSIIFSLPNRWTVFVMLFCFFFLLAFFPTLMDVFTFYSSNLQKFKCYKSVRLFVVSTIFVWKLQSCLTEHYFENNIHVVISNIHSLHMTETMVGKSEINFDSGFF